MYKILLSNIAKKALDKLPDSVFQRIDKRIQSLKFEPRPVGCIKLSGNESYRIRVGDYRIIYTINDKIIEIYIFNIAHRKEIYKRK
jgi:mRNA interferase RelE/StbE